MILAPVIRQRFFDSNGNPLSGGKVYTYAAGTTTPQATYTDQGGLTPNANPVVLDANGEAPLWLDAGLAYKFVLKDSSDVTQWTVDQVSVAGNSGLQKWNSGTSYATGDIVADSAGSGILFVSLQDNNVGNALTDSAYWRMALGKTRTVSTNTSILASDDYIRSDTTGGALTHTLPSCTAVPVGKRITVKDVGSGAHATTVKGAGSDTIDGNNTYVQALDQYSAMTVSNTGSAWDVV